MGGEKGFQAAVALCGSKLFDPDVEGGADMRLWLAMISIFALAACEGQNVAPVPASLQNAASAPVVEAPSPVTGRTVGSTLVEPATGETGRWVAMADIGRPVQGWITDQETGRSAQVELRPLEQGAIDLISLDALRALGIDQARLVVLDVYYDLSSL